jgi:YHS domain-containing protein
MADLTMLRRELVIGYVIAGFLAVLVPNHVWNDVFLHGHGVWTSVENAVVGPIIAIVSFVCSVGNVALAAALWKGGISFGGVISFVFADLITLPLLLIYRKYYGWRLTLRLLAWFWAIMAVAGLIVEGLFSGAGLIPTYRSATIAPTHFEWNYTTILNLIFLALFAVLYWLYHNRERLGGGAGLAMDPVCGMQVRTADAPARSSFAGQTVWFCSDRCRERFDADPARFASQPAGSENLNGNDGETDPVCGMTVDSETSEHHRHHGGRGYSFCGKGCADAFDVDPAHYAAASDAGSGGRADDWKLA